MASAPGARRSARQLLTIHTPLPHAQDVAQRGWLLDGYPRSASQAEAIEKEGIRPDVFLLIQVSLACSRLVVALPASRAPQPAAAAALGTHGLHGRAQIPLSAAAFARKSPV